MDKIKKQIYNYIDNPLDAGVNFDTGLYYESIGQTAAALSFFLRCAELTDNDTLAYEALLKTYRCIAKQTRRPIYEKEQLMIALTQSPKRPEAYFLLSQWHSAREEWTEADYYANVAQKVCDFSLPALGSDVGYVGHWGLKFQEAFVCWYRGKREHSYKLWKELYNNPKIKNEEYFSIIINNLINFNLIKTKHDPIIFSIDQIRHLNRIHKYPGIRKKVKHNYSQCFQDMFVLSCLQGYKNGTYLEIGGGKPYDGNNTALLEEIGWKGLSIDLHQPYVDEWNESGRTNPIIRTDATQINYLELLKSNPDLTKGDKNKVGYLQIDIDPCVQSFDVLTKIPFEDYTFGVITFEHDHYVDGSRQIRDKSRNLLESHGYVLIAGNISPDENSPFEDWWVHPHIVPEDIINKLKQPLQEVLPVKNYFFRNEP